MTDKRTTLTPHARRDPLIDDYRRFSSYRFQNKIQKNESDELIEDSEDSKEQEVVETDSDSKEQEKDKMVLQDDSKETETTEEDKPEIAMPDYVVDPDVWENAAGVTSGEKMRNYIFTCDEKEISPFK